ncbi:MAG: hypothetical protein LW707_09310 [Sphingobacteriales bacterium]|nr:hypothetical protein [Sphingobacteriales bacterium]
MSGPIALRSLLFLLPVLLFMPVRSVIAQNIKSEYYLFDRTNGLNRSRINEIERDSSGFYWLATEKGLVRFDGRNFVHLHENSDEEASVPIRQIVLFDNNLYALAEDRRCFLTDVRTCTTRLLHQGPVVDIAQVNNEAYYVLFSDGKLERHGRDGSVRSIRIASNALSRLIYYQGQLLVSIQFQGVYSIDPKTLAVLRIYPVNNSGFEESFDLESGLLFFTSSYRAYSFDPEIGFRQIDLLDPLNPGVSAFEYINDSISYIIYKRKTLYKRSDQRFTPVDLVSSIDFELYNVYYDPPGNILVGTNQGLLYLMTSNQGVRNLTDRGLEGDGPLRVRRRILQEPDGNVLLVGSEYVYRTDLANRIERLSDWKLAGYDALIDRGSLFIATEGQSLMSLDLKTGKPTASIVNPANGGQCFSIERHWNGREFLIGAIGELVVWNTGTYQSRSISVGDPNVIVKAIRCDPETRRIYVGTESGFYCFDSLFKSVPAFKSVEKELEDDHIGDFLIRKSSTELWIATSRGIAVTDRIMPKGVRFLPISSFVNPRTVSMLEDSSGRVWASTFNGIIGFDPTSSDFIRLGKRNGLINAEFNYKSAANLSDGRLIFGGLNGYDIIDPSQFDFKPSSRIGFVNGYQLISFEDTAFFSLGSDGPIEVSFDQSRQHLRLFLSSADISAASKYSFEYRMDGEAWIPLPSAFIDIYYLNKSSCEFEFRAFDEFGRIIPYTPTRVVLNYPFYYSPFFIWGMTGVAILLLVLLIVLSFQRLRREQQLKERITMDLHDEVGTILTRVLYLSQDIEQAELRYRLTRSLNSALYSLRVFIYSLSKKNKTVQGLYDEVADLVNQSFSNSDVRLSLQLSKDGEYEINPELYRDLKLVFYELLGNMLRHSQATSFSIDWSVSLWQMHIVITDNGVITDIPEGNDTGNGLKNIRRRVERQQGKIEISISPAGHGLCYVIDLTIK